MSFRKFGGLQYSATHNFVNNRINTSASLFVTKAVGQPNTIINVESDIKGNIYIEGDLTVTGKLTVTEDAFINTVRFGRELTSETDKSHIIIGTSGEKMHLPLSYVAVGIDNYNPVDGITMDISGNVQATSFTTTSDYRIKTNVTSLHAENDSFSVDALNPVAFDNIQLQRKDIGFIAHELQEVFPYLVSGEKDGEHLQSVNYTGLIALLVKEVQGLKKRVHELEEKNKTETLTPLRIF